MEQPKARGYLPRAGYRLFDHRDPPLLQTLKSQVAQNGDWLRDTLNYPLS